LERELQCHPQKLAAKELQTINPRKSRQVMDGQNGQDYPGRLYRHEMPSQIN